MAPAPPPDPQQMALQVFAKALELLKNDRMRTFRIDIETDSTVEADAVMEKEAVVEFMGAMAQFMGAALPIGQAAPPLIKPFAQSMQYAMRRFKMGRSVETAFDQAFTELEQQAKNPAPPPPDPAMEAEKVRAAAEIEKIKLTAQMDQQKMAAEMQLEQARIQIKQQELELDEQRLQMEAAFAAQKHQRDMEMMQAKAMMPKPANQSTGAAA